MTQYVLPNNRDGPLFFTSWPVINANFWFDQMFAALTFSKACHGVGVEHVGGDMFESIPKGDAIFMKVSLYDSVNSFHWAL